MASLKEVVEALTELVSATNTITSCPEKPLEIPGIAVADAFDAGDCFGTVMTIIVPKKGILYGATYFDLDDEGSQIDLEVFKHSITQIASDAAWAPSDTDILNFIAEIQFVGAAFDDHGTCQTCETRNLGIAYTAPVGKLYIQAVCRGTPNIAAGNVPRVQLHILSLDTEWR